MDQEPLSLAPMLIGLAGGLALFLPRVQGTAGDLVRIRIHAHDVILARERPVGLSALNVLPATVASVRRGGGPGAIVQLAAGPDRLLARITGRSATALELAPDIQVYAIVKSVAVAQSDVTPAADGAAPP